MSHFGTCSAVGSRAKVESPAKRGTTVASAGPASLGGVPSVIDGLVDQRPQLRPEGIGHRGQELGHEDGEEILVRVDPEGRAGRAAPVESPAEPAMAVATGPAHGETQAESDAVEPGFAEPADGEIGQRRPAGQVVGVISSRVLRPRIGGRPAGRR